MKKEQSSIREKWVTMRLTQEEFNLFEKLRTRSTEKTNSNYLRKLALNQPITKLMRNKSLDEATAAIIALKKELYYIGHNFNQVVHKLHTLDRIPQFRSWCEQYEATRLTIERETKSLLIHANQIISQWSHE